MALRIKLSSSITRMVALVFTLDMMPMIIYWAVSFRNRLRRAGFANGAKICLSANMPHQCLCVAFDNHVRFMLSKRAVNCGALHKMEIFCKKKWAADKRPSLGRNVKRIEQHRCGSNAAYSVINGHLQGHDHYQPASYLLLSSPPIRPMPNRYQRRIQCFIAIADPATRSNTMQVMRPCPACRYPLKFAEQTFAAVIHRQSR